MFGFFSERTLSTTTAFSLPAFATICRSGSSVHASRYTGLLIFISARFTVLRRREELEFVECFCGCYQKRATTRLIFGRSPGLRRAATPKKVQRKNDNRCYKQQVNQATSDKPSIKPNQPEQQQHYKNCP